jgi:hypothetical protein
MANSVQGLAFQSAAGGVNFEGLLAGVRALQPKCAECGIPVDESTTGVRYRQTAAGATEKLCRACAVTEIGESLMDALPR